LSANAQRLDEAKVETLRAWGEGLQEDPREEVRAAGRAITMLVEEIERLNIDLWHARTDHRQESPGRQAAEQADGAAQAEAPQRALPAPLPAF
jgi:hypothetical protein